MRSDFPVPPDHAARASDDSPFDRSGVDLRIASDTGLLFPPSDGEFARISEEFKREATDSSAVITVRPPVDLLNPSHPLAQSHIPFSSPGPGLQPEPQHLVPPLPVLRTPSPSRTILNRKRKRHHTLEDNEDEDEENLASPTTAIIQRPVKPRNTDDKPSAKRQRLTTQQHGWDHIIFREAGRVLSPRPGPETRENSGVGELRHSLPALIADSSQGISAEKTRSEAETPAGSQVPADVSAHVPEDVFGPVILSVKAKKISDTFPAQVLQNDADDVTISDSENHTANVSHKSTRFSLSGNVEKKKHKVFRKTPVIPRVSLRFIEAENALAAETGAEGQDVPLQVPSLKKRRVTGARAGKRKAPPSAEPEPTTNSEGGLPSISVGKPPSKLRRGRSASIQPHVPPPARRSTRCKK
jgi:hypothetical protein